MDEGLFLPRVMVRGVILPNLRKKIACSVLGCSGCDNVFHLILQGLRVYVESTTTAVLL